MVAGIGGVGAVRPYGIGVEVGVEDGGGEVRKGALGALGFMGL
ncbi:hypothetical protein SNOG_02293 [Parastagonospora nodorum SN15]|uniref:Uncharacterized protein n=1 Tax=Phaeosphaeria nodorum (strain SN15 / ATCC MYA-4574 / FGSC 10173) TaxID=321614 RepID=Q0V121_PHANO|nr:hypothetical protein SNOG_02293 [Parastagonospora nodorum SN15]EAT90505.1 hypothetical protein SNOG_02293 [Parastagonospora nodorum SN15]